MCIRRYHHVSRKLKSIGNTPGTNNQPIIPYNNSTASSGSFSRSLAISIGAGVGSAILVLSLLGGGLYYLHRKSLKPEAKEASRKWFQFQDMGAPQEEGSHSSRASTVVAPEEQV